MLKKLFSQKLPKTNSLIKSVYAAHKPGIISGSFSGARWRYDSMGKTLDCITNSAQCKALQQQADFNLSQWEQTSESPPKLVEVVKTDWGIATMQATKKHGKLYSVLNMANSIYPGGSVLEGGSAQEENMWHRSTCANSLLDDGIYLEESSKLFRYTETMTKRLEAKIKMTDEEYARLKSRHHEADPIAYKAFLSRDLRVCFRGPEIKLEAIDLVESGGRPQADIGQSYILLRPDDIFPFLELRSAAPQLPFKPKAMDEKALTNYKADLKRRIASQLDTLILEGRTHVILGAFGCGEFNNDPKIVAPIYAEEIEKRTDFFDHIVFAVLNTANNNYEIFEHSLKGMNLTEKKPEIRGEWTG